MDFDFKEVSDISKTGKLKKYAPFIIAGAGIGFVAYIVNRNKSGSIDPTFTDTGDSGLAGVVSDSNGQMSSALADISGQMNNMILNNNEMMMDAFSQMQFNTFEYLDSIRGGSEITPAKETVITEENNVINNQETIFSSIIPDNSINNRSIYFDGAEDDIQYKQAKDIVDQSTWVNKTDLKKSVAGLGNNGVGYTVENFADNANRLSNDKSFVDSEKERTELVISNRKAQNLSTDVQEKYLKNLNLRK